jgi:RHS repeat-associated protein
MFLYNGELGVATDSNGLYYMRARYYNPEIKRFINQDVMTGSIVNTPTLNRYAYVNGNPISLNDPFGLSPFLNWIGNLPCGVDLFTQDNYNYAGLINSVKVG